MGELFDRVVLPIADPDDAAGTCEALDGYDVGSVVAVHVVEKAGGAPDKASVEQREEHAAEMFDVVESRLAEAVSLETRIAYGTDVADAIFDVADEVGATSIVITPRGGSRWIRLLTGDVALSLVTETDRPVVVLPDVNGVDEPGAAGQTDAVDRTGEDAGADESGAAVGSEEMRATDRNDEGTGGSTGE